MASFDLKPEPRPKSNSLIWNVLTVVVLLGICGLAYIFLNIYLNPTTSRYNPFAPAPLPTLFETETPTITIIPLAPTWTDTPTLVPSPTRTKAPTWTPLPEMITPSATDTPTDTPTAEIPTAAGTLTVTTTSMPASATITYAASTTIHADSACTWMGVGGTVTGVDGKPLQFQTVQLGGTLSGKTINKTMLSGSAPAYGTSGFEFVLGDTPIASTQGLWIQLFDNTGTALTDKIYFDTFTDCAKNLVMVVFTKTR
ncbi:MAG TPA: hypothetical protein VMC09_03845 [Anaerolineales bacterium]|nr:hypothetical protein [Anaerolineales bacterium]